MSNNYLSLFLFDSERNVTVSTRIEIKRQCVENRKPHALTNTKVQQTQRTRNNKLFPTLARESWKRVRIKSTVCCEMVYILTWLTGHTNIKTLEDRAKTHTQVFTLWWNQVLPPQDVQRGPSVPLTSHLNINEEKQRWKRGKTGHGASQHVHIYNTLELI